MRTIPRIQMKDSSDKIYEARIQKLTRIFAIAFILLIQLAIIFKMLT